MEFGKISNVDQVNWTLPPEDPCSLPYFKNLREKSHEAGFQMHIGAPAWGHKEWMGKIYPTKTPSSEFLYHYSRYFNCVELNTTHYRIPTKEQTRKWLEQVPPDFLFCPKIFQGLSHENHGLVNKDLVRAWLDFLTHLNENLGPSFLQLPPYFDYSYKSELFSFLKSWPDSFPLALEFRHSSWFDSGKVLPALVQYLQERGIGLVITDVAGRRDVLHTSLSANFSLLRFIGNNLHPSDFLRAEVWTERFFQWKNLGIQKIFLFVHEPDDISTPEMTEFFLDQMNQKGLWTPTRLSPPYDNQLKLVPFPAERGTP